MAERVGWQWRQFGWLGLSAVVAAIDQWSKGVVTEHLVLGERIDVVAYFSWVRWHNDGAAFSFLTGAGGWQLWLFVGLGFVFFGFIVNELRQLKPGQKLHGFAFGMLLGGALGNLIDRVSEGYVVDFLLFHWEDAYFPAFNAADSAIFLGAVIWIGLLIRESRERRQSGTRERPDDV